MAIPESKYSEDVRQHLTFIQDVITRMNSNSFSMKGWMLAIVSALCAIYASNAANQFSYIYFIIAIPVVIIFWLLDAYYLKMERQYRDLYKEICKSKEETDFNMNANGYHGKYPTLSKKSKELTKPQEQMPFLVSPFPISTDLMNMY